MITYKHLYKRYSLSFSLLLLILFFLPPLYLLLPLFFYTVEDTNDRRFKNISYFNILVVLLLIFLFICSVNVSSAFFLNDYPVQKQIELIKSEQRIHVEHFFSILFISPLIEELYFRGILLSQLNKRFTYLFSILVSSLLFSFIHFNILSFSTLLSLGISLSFLRIWYNSILIPIIGHIIFNSIMLYFIFY